ncbi:MAG: YvcK family protein [bacterium]|nr:YvcK family protein [bacterium]
MQKKGLKIVTIGGGTGTFTLLTGLKKYTNNLTAVVSMADSGGSTGRLRDEFGILPPGDVRRALIALSSGHGQLLLRQLFEYRFENGSAGSTLKGHSFGNLFLTALNGIFGDEVRAIQEAGKLLDIKGEVLPVTLTDTHLVARLEDGTLIRGETNIDIRLVYPNLKILDVFLDPPAEACKSVLQAIRRADLIVIGPGDLYTSIIPNILVKGVSEAIAKTRGKVIYVCNIMNKHGETDSFTASGYVKEIQSYLGSPAGRKSYIDKVLVNEGRYPKRLLAKYAEEKAYPVEIDISELEDLVPSVRIVDCTVKGSLLRHDSEKLARGILNMK